MEADRMQTQATQQSQHPCVMLVEDDQHIGDALTHLLQDKGYQVDRCFDGLEAIEHLRNGSTPDAIVLDLMMPRLNGWEFRVEQRRVPDWAAIPVIVVSGDASAQASAIDADAYLRKPVAAAALLDSLERLLQARERALLEARSEELARMNALGVLAAGLAHEINNPLAFVTGNLELARAKCEMLTARLPAHAQEPMQSLSYLLGEAQRGAERIADVVRGVSTFARADTDQVVPMNVQDVLESSLKLVANERRASVLVIDDEPMMCELLRNMLQDDYDVTTFSSSVAALDHVLSGASLEVVLCDLMMPELTGMDLYAEVLRKKPDQAARFIFMTGGTFTERASEFLDGIGAAPLMKPFRNEELHHAVAARLRQFERRGAREALSYS